MRRVCLFTTPFPFMQAINSGIAACSKRVGPWRIEVQFFSGDQVGIGEFLNSQSFDGVILTYDAPFTDALLKNHPRVVAALVDRYPIPLAGLDDHAVGEMGAQHLLECGYQKFAFYGTSERWSVLRYEGFKAHLRKHGYVPQTNYRHADNARSVGPVDDVSPEDFARRLDRPVAVMACNDSTARRIADRAIELGLRVPGDVAVLGVDNDEICCETGACPLSSIDTDLHRVGFEAALMLDRLLRGTDSPGAPASVLVKPKEVVRRQSTSMFAHEDPDIASALRYIYEHACEGITVDQVCKHIALSRRRFEQRFFEAVGHSPGHHIRNVRAERAKSLLKETNMTLSEISIRCGYAYISGFSSAFRSIVGMSPGAYRKKNGSFSSDPSEDSAE